MIRMLSLALVLTAFAASDATAQSTGQYDDMSLADMIRDGEMRVERMVDGVGQVRALRETAEDGGDASAYQRLNNLYTRMNGRLRVAEEALAYLHASRDSGRSKAQRKVLTFDRANDTHNYQLIVAADNANAADLRTALSLMGDGTTPGEGTTVVGGGTGIPDYDVTDRGRTMNPDGPGESRDNSDFQGSTPADAAL